MELLGIRAHLNLICFVFVLSLRLLILAQFAFAVAEIDHSYSISVTTLDEVFLRVAEQGEMAVNSQLEHKQVIEQYRNSHKQVVNLSEAELGGFNIFETQSE